MNDAPLKVLLVESDADAAAATEHMLADGGGDVAGRFAVKTAPRLNTACHLLDREPFDAVLLGLQLPRCVGLESFQRVRAQKPGLPIVILAGARDRALAEEAVRQGAQDYVVKGTLCACAIRRVLRHAVERQRLLAGLEGRPCACAGQAPEERERILGGVSHDLRNTVTTVKAAVYCLGEGLPDPLTAKQRQLVAMISRNIDRQVRLLDDALDLSRLRSERAELETVPVDLSALAAVVVREAEAAGPKPRIELAVPCRLPPVLGDASSLRRLLRKLLDNARRHAASRVRLEAFSGAPDEVGLSVADDGPGIPPERLETLFDFFGTAAKGGAKGRGLGLALCREIVERHHGRIWAENGRPGARFHIRLPRAARACAANAQRRPGASDAAALSQPVQQ